MKSFRRILMLMLALALVFTLFACNVNVSVTCNHRDEDKDGICDDCDECLECIDEDEDGLCDNCGECLECVDEDGDGLCDNCDEEMEEGGEGEGIALTGDGEIFFGLVLGSDVGSNKMIIDSYVDILAELGYELSVVEDKAGNEECDIEVLIGTVTSRGEEYEYDRYSLGAEGYAITAIDDTKIVITGGSETTLGDAITKFFEEILGIDDKADDVYEVLFTEEHDEVALQDNYRITSLSIGTNDLKGYEIVVEKGATAYKNAAEELQNFFYQRAGYYLPITTPDKAGDKTISFVSAPKDKAGINGFRVRVDGNSLYIECAYDNYFDKAFGEYYDLTFTGKTGDIKLGDFTGEVNISVISYADFGAVGDGKTDDLAAIRAAHEEANKGGQTVVAEKGKTYYIGPTYKNPISVMTNVDWKGCKFIFDSKALTNDSTGNVFNIVQTIENRNTSIGDKDSRLIELNKPAENGEPVIKGMQHGDAQTTKLDLGLGFPAMLTVFNSNSRTYIRWGYVDSKGGEQREVVVIDENGNIDPTTPFLLDYEKVTSITVHRIDVEPITIQNATVYETASIINLGPGGYHSYNHGINVSRPNTTVKNLTHIIEGEISKNAPVREDENGLCYDVTKEGFSYSNGLIYKNGTEYKGDDVKPFTGPSFGAFLQVSSTHNTLIENCVFQARVHYVEGTYDIGANTANKIVFKNCTQSNFFDTRPQYTKFGDSTFPNLSVCWGVMGSNYTKNMDYLDCVLTRYDAHAGVLNGKVIGGKLAILRLIGGGTFIIEGIELYNNYRTASPFQLREDYGATFFGTITIKDTVIKDGQYSATGNYGAFAALFDAPVAPWDNGYVNHFPNIILDNVSVETTDTEVELVAVGGQKYFKDGEHFPARSVIKDDVSNPDALITTYFETKNPNVVTDTPERFEHLKGFKKVTKAPDKLSNGEYTVVDNGNGTYTVIAKGVKNINPYQPPEFIEIRNMKGAVNTNGKPLSITIYDCNFFKNVEIRDTDKVLKKVKVPK